MHSASISPSGQRPRHMPGSRCGQRHCSTSEGWPPPAGHTPSGSLAAAALSACSLVALPSLLLSNACTRKPPRQQRLVWVAPGQLSVRSVVEQLRPCLSPRRRCRCARVRGANSSYSLAVPVHRTSRVPLPSAPARMHTYSPSASSISAARSRSRWARHPDLQRRSPSPCALRNCKRAQYVKRQAEQARTTQRSPSRKHACCGCDLRRAAGWADCSLRSPRRTPLGCHRVQPPGWDGPQAGRPHSDFSPATEATRVP